jgi:AraC-like DNA-binding protein
MNVHEYLKLHENKTHGSFLLPIIRYHNLVPEHFTNIPIHWHEEIEIVLVYDGKGIFNIDLNPCVVEKGDILILNPYVLHAFQQHRNDTYHADTFVFNMNMLENSNSDSCSMKYITPMAKNEIIFPFIIKTTDSGYDKLRYYFEQAIRIYKEKENGFELELKAYLYLFIHTLFLNVPAKKHSSKKIDDETTEKIKLTLNFIKENYTEQLTIKEIAEQLNFSEYHFMRFFKKHIGMTCIEYINNYRLDIAAKFLSTSNRSIMEVALDVGFNNISYFNKLFKDKYKVTPKEFRQTILEPQKLLKSI